MTKRLIIIFSLLTLKFIGQTNGFYNSVNKTRYDEFYGFLELNKKGSFKLGSGSDHSLYCELKGTWILSADTLIISAKERKSPKKGAWRKFNYQGKYLVKKDSLVNFIILNGEIVFNKSESFTKAQNE